MISEIFKESSSVKTILASVEPIGVSSGTAKFAPSSTSPPVDLKTTCGAASLVSSMNIVILVSVDLLG